MTREEAMHVVDIAFGVPQAVRRAGENRTYHEAEIRKAKEMAIKALEQEPCEDAISRQAVDEAIYDYSRSCDVNYAQIMEYIDKIPSVNPQDCDTCEVGNPCMYCKHEFEPQESEEI